METQAAPFDTTCGLSFVRLRTRLRVRSTRALKARFDTASGLETLDDLDVVTDLGVAVQEVVLGDQGRLVIEEEPQSLGEEEAQELPRKEVGAVMHQERVGLALTPAARTFTPSLPLTWRPLHMRGLCQPRRP